MTQDVLNCQPGIIYHEWLEKTGRELMAESERRKALLKGLKRKKKR